MGGRLRIMRRRSWRVSGLRSSFSGALDCGKNFRGGGLSPLGVDDAAIGTDDVDGAANDAPAGAILFGHFPAFIDKKRKGEFVRSEERRVGKECVP